MINPPKPEIKAFIVADTVIQEKGSNKWSVIGIFDRLHAHSFPCVHNQMAVYVKLADAQGDYEIRLEFCDDQAKRLAVFEGLKLTVPSRLMMIDFGVQAKNLVLPQPGSYRFDLYLNGSLCGSMPMDVEGDAPAGQSHQSP